jgi:co-chaperonin GroES (HSP10)
MSLKLLGNRVLVVPDIPSRALPEGLVMPDIAADDIPTSGRVFSVGLGFRSPAFPDPDKLLNRRVFFSPVSGQDIAFGSDTWISLMVDEILAIEETEQPNG